jgi:hypothetical protein
MYSSTLSLTSELDGMGGQRLAPAALPPGKTRYPMRRRLGGPQGRSGRVRKIPPPPGFDPRTAQPVEIRGGNSFHGNYCYQLPSSFCGSLTQTRRFTRGALQLPRLNIRPTLIPNHFVSYKGQKLLYITTQQTPKSDDKFCCIQPATNVPCTVGRT